MVKESDLEYATRLAKRVEGKILQTYDAINFNADSISNIRAVDPPMIYASLHKSHLDYMVICLKMFQEQLAYPKIIAGSNLLEGTISKSIRLFTGIDFERLGAESISRSSGPKAVVAMREKISKILDSGTALLLFPEFYEARYNGVTVIKTGRSYTGHANDFAPALLTPHTDYDLPVFPLSVTYDFIAEDQYFPRLFRANRSKHGSGFIAPTLGWMNYIRFESAFFHNIFSLGAGEIYLDAGKPLILDYNGRKNRGSKKEFADIVQKQSAALYRVTMPALISHFASKGMTNIDHIARSVEDLLVELRKKNIPLAHSASEREFFKYISLMAKRKIITLEKYILTPDTELVPYYANTIKHHMDTLDTRI